MATHPKDLRISDFSYPLPEERIARYPLPERDQSKLLVYRDGAISESRYNRLDEQLPKDSLLLFNNTKVVEARLLFSKSTGSSIELFCLEPADEYPDITTAMLQKGSVLWKCLVGGAKKWKEEALVKTIDTAQGTLTLRAKKEEKRNDYFLVELSWDNSELSFAEMLHLAGSIPLPPYLNRPPEASDQQRYQTIYARHDGSVAAPTAGLHFTPALLQKLADRSIHTGFVTLHVGAGTFKPVKAETMEQHDMHAEFIDVPAATIRQIIAQLENRQPIVAVGTTSLRTIESLYWLGLAVHLQPGLQPEALYLGQWTPYEQQQHCSPVQALESLLVWMERFSMERLITKTQIIIAPGYRFTIAHALITNFHQPQSTLLLLVAALIGEDWKKIYHYALEHDFRFLSYGDGCLLWGK